MKKTLLKLNVLTLAIIILALTSSCGGGKKEYSIKPSSTAVKGDLSNYFEVVDGSYKLEKGAEKFDQYKIKVQLKRKDGAFDFDAKDLESRGYFRLCTSLLGEGGTPIVLGSTEGMGQGDGNEGRKELIALKTGETGWVEFRFTSLDEKDEMDKVKTFEINSSVNKEEQTSSSSSSSDDKDKSSSTASSGDCDKFLKDYEAFANSYIKVLKKYKANPNDASILSEYTEMAQKETEMQTNISTCTDPKYASKILELNTKIAQAAM